MFRANLATATGEVWYGVGAGGGGYSFVACLGHLAIDHAPL